LECDFAFVLSQNGIGEPFRRWGGVSETRGTSVATRILMILGILSFLAILVFGSAGFHLASSLFYWGRPESAWRTPHQPMCNNIEQSWFQVDPSQSQELPSKPDSCERNLEVPFERLSFSQSTSLSQGAYYQYKFASGAPKNLVVYVPGIHANRLEMLRFKESFQSAQSVVLVVELPNQGDASHNGRGTGWGCSEHLLLQEFYEKALPSYLETLSPHQPLDLFLWGTSMGGLAQALAWSSQSNALPLKGLFLESPILSPTSLLENPNPSQNRGIMGQAVTKIATIMANRRLKVDSFPHKCELGRALNLLTPSVPVIWAHSQTDAISSFAKAESLAQQIKRSAFHFLSLSSGSHGLLWSANPGAFQREVDRWMQISRPSFTPAPSSNQQFSNREHP
jgi:hypothetical protein